MMSSVVENSVKQTRRSNFEMLRIVAMLMIVGSHLASHGVQHYLAGPSAFQIFNTGSLVNKLAVCFLNPGGEIGVAIFFLITGYFQINKKNVSVLKVVLESFFYGVFAIVLFVIAKLFFGGVPGVSTSMAIKFFAKTLFNPATSGAWWFVAAYVLLLLVSPLLNKYLLKLNKKGFIATIIAFWIIWYSMAMTTGAVFYILERGMFFYIIGAFIRLHLTKIESKGSKCANAILALAAWILGMFVSYGIAVYSVDPNPSQKIELIKKIFVLAKTSVVTPLCAFFVFRFFESLDLGINAVINKIAATTFGVYLIHESETGRSFIWYRIIKPDILFCNETLFPLYMILLVLAVFVVCSAIDLIRVSFIEPIAIRKAQQLLNSLKKIFIKQEEYTE